MNDVPRDGLNFEEEDRLPWLEPAMDDEEESGVSPLRLLGTVLAGLVLLALVVGGVYMLRSLKSDTGEGEVIAAPEGSYKIPANEADAKKFQGVGDATFATSEGVERDGKIDASRLPEAPMATAPAANGKASANAEAVMGKGAIAAKPGLSVSAKVADETKAGSGAVKAAVAPHTGGAQVQLGAYGSSAMAQDAWAKLSRRFDYLATLTPSVQPVAVGNTTLYRLRASAANANALCGKLKVAGESCMVVN
jgi:SPOR domain